ncbi:MAG: hypothetical protein QM725_06820 [Lacibacter sp.]
MQQKLIVFAFLFFLAGCLGTAKLSDFSQTASGIDFDKYSKEYKDSSSPSWTFKTSNEYYFEKELVMEETEFVNVVSKSLIRTGHKIAYTNMTEKCVLGKRGLTANEWGSVTGVYYKYIASRLQVYIKTKITQDVTGGWKENRAMEVGKFIEAAIGGAGSQ